VVVAQLMATAAMVFQVVAVAVTTRLVLQMQLLETVVQV
jgi:hypothetical protein